MDETKRTLLIVDDEKTIHRALERTLRREPFELLHAYDAAEAEAILRQRSDVAGVICDHYMPGTPGLEFLMHVRRTNPDLVAILLTAQADIQMVMTAMNEGRLHRFFTKPWDGDEVRGSLRELLGLDPAGSPASRARSVASAQRLLRDTAPQQDESGAYVIEPPDEG